MRVRAEFEPRQIRHISVECPHCKNWFWGEDITEDRLNTVTELFLANFRCPICFEWFGTSDIEINECDFDEICKNVNEKVTIWKKVSD